MEKEKQDKPEITEGQLKVARLNLEAETLKGYAALKGLESGEYGNLGSGVVESILSKAPDKHTYDTLMAPALKNDLGLNKEYLKKTSMEILKESLAILSIDEAIKYLDVNISLDEKFSDKRVYELGKDASLVIGEYFSKITEEILTDLVLPSRAEQRKKGLEEIFAQKEPEEKK